MLIIGGINLYRAFALYKIEKTFNVLNGVVPDFKKEILFSDYLISQVGVVQDGESGIIQQEHNTTIQTGDNTKTDYRFIGPNPNNYVCLEEKNCTEENMYRIIGVMPTQNAVNSNYELRVKLMKQTSYGAYYWNGNSNTPNNWNSCSLNNQVLNGTYWNGISSYQKYIDNTVWYLGSLASSADKSASFIPETSFYYERSRSVYSSNAYYTVKNIGLMYPSDYGFATSGNETTSRAECLKKILVTNNDQVKQYAECLQTSWLMRDDIATLTANSTYKTNFWACGPIFCGVTGMAHPVFPVFHLKANILYKSGKGTKENPYQIRIGE